MHWWEAIDQENEAILQAKVKNIDYQPELLLTGEIRKQILVRSHYLLYKSRDKWTLKQNLRAEVLFKEYPQIAKA